MEKAAGGYYEYHKKENISIHGGGVSLMSLFTWNEKYSVHVENMDNQHKRLFELINRLHEAMSTGKGNAELGEILNGLKDYTVTHFADEEKYMESFGYTGLAEQKKQHKIFVDKISEYATELNEKKLGLSIEVLNFLKDWLVHHIQNIDTKYTENFHAHGMN